MKLLIANFIFIFSTTILSSKSPPNIVIMFMDDMGYADIGAFGAKAYPPHTWTGWQRKEGNLLTSMSLRQFARHPEQAC